MRRDFFICQFLAVIISSQLFLAHITDVINCFLSWNFSCKVLPEVTELLTQKVEIGRLSEIDVCISIPSERVHTH